MAKSLVAQLFHVQADMVLRFFLVGGGVLLFWRGVWGVFDFYDIKNVSSIVGVPLIYLLLSSSGSGRIFHVLQIPLIRLM